MGKASRKKTQPTTTPAAAAPPQAKAATSSDRTTAIVIALALAVLTFLAFENVRRHQFVNFDDPDYVTENDHVLGGLTGANVAWAFTSFHASNWHPLTWLSHQLDVELFGTDAGMHHLTNVLLHAANAILLFFLLRAATRRTWPSAFVAALFAIHPAHVESVAWVSERKDVLSTFFFMLTLLLFVRYAQTRGKGTWALTILTFALGLMAKPMLVTLPMVLLLLDVWPLRRIEPEAITNLGRWRPLLVEKLPHFALIVPMVIVTLKAQTEAMGKVSLPLRVANALESYVAYIGKLLWPSRLAAIYPYRVQAVYGFAAVAFVILIAITVVAWMQFRKRPYLLIGWLWFVGTLVPVIGIVQVGAQSMADRYTYIPFVGLFIAITWLATELVPAQKALAAAGAAIVAVLAFATHAQAAYWKDSHTLFARTVAVTKRNPNAHINLGDAYLREAQYASAMKEYRAALALNDRDARSHAGLGIAFAKMGDNKNAERELRIAVAFDPDNHEVNRALGRVILAAGRKEEAVALLQKSQEGKEDPETRAVLAAASGDNASAIAAFEEAVRRKPESVELRNDLAAALARAGRDDEALVQYREALRIAPQQYDVNMNLGALLSRQEKDLEAVDAFLAAAKERPQSAEPHVYVALVYAKLGRFRDAERAMTTALETDREQSNTTLTNAIRIPPKETNAEEYLAFLKSR